MDGTPQTPGLYEEILNAIKGGHSSLTPIPDLEQRIDALPDENVGILFSRLAGYFNQQLQEAGEDECKRAHVKHLYRRLFGPRYSCLFLTNVAVRDIAGEQPNADPTAFSLKALVEESLQWSNDAVLAEGLIYYVDDQGEEKWLHECMAVRQEGQDLAGPMRAFLQELKNYVQDCGSSARTKAHLKLLALPADPTKLAHTKLKSDPLLGPRLLDSNNYSEDLILAPKDPPDARQTKIGDQKAFRKAVWDYLGKSLDLQEDFDVVHYSAGSDSFGDEKIRATAHLYVIFRKKAAAMALDYTIAMRETLSRLTIAFALERMQTANQAVRRAQLREEERHRILESKVRDLTQNIQHLGSKAYEVMAMVAPSAWQSLKDWIDDVGLLSESKNARTMDIPGIKTVVSDHHWKDPQYAAALLRLVKYTGKSSDSKNPEEVWYAERERIQTSPEAYRVEHPMWRVLDRLGVLSRELSKLAMTKVSHALLKDSLWDKRRCFETNGFSILGLLLTIGGDWNPSVASSELSELALSTEVTLVQDLRVGIVLDGLNMIQDTLTGKKLSFAQPINLQLERGQKADELWLRILFPNPRATEFTKLCSGVQDIVAKHANRHPGYQRHDMSMSILTALGLNEGNWVAESQSLKVESTELAMFSKSANASDECVARCSSATEFLIMSYRILQA